MSAVSGSPTQIKTSCETLDLLAGTPDDAFLDGDIGYVSSVRRYFQIVRDDPALVPNASTVLATFSGNGYWVALEIQSTAWSYQPTWYIDATHGDDENDGSTQATAIATWAEFRRRVSYLAVSMSVYILTNLDEVITGRFSSASATIKLTVAGVPTALATSTNVTTFVNPTANARGTVDAGGIDFALYLNKIIRAVGTENLFPITSNAAAVGRGGFWADSLTTTKPANGSIVEVLDLPTVRTVRIYTDGVPVTVKYLSLTSTTDGYSVIDVGAINYGTTTAPHWQGCIFAYNQMGKIPITLYSGCLLTRSTTLIVNPNGSNLQFYGGGSTRAFSNGGNPGFLSFNGFLMEAGSSTFTLSGAGTATDSATAPLGIFTTAATAISLSGNGTTFTSGGATYGTSSGAGGAGVTINAGARLSVSSGTPTITGATNDFTVDGLTALVAPPTAGGVWAAAVDLSGAAGAGWAKWIAAGRKFINYATGSTVSN